MFLYDFVQFEVPFEAVKGHLAETAWMAPLARAAFREGEAAAALGLDGVPTMLRRDIEIEFAEPIEGDDVLAVPLRWQATGPSRLFPTLNGHLELSRLGAGRTHLSVLANYDPPDGVPGPVERRALHHFAEAGMRAFLRRVADALVALDGAAARSV